MTITEGLAEIKTIQKRISAKREAVARYLARQDTQKDRLPGEGGEAAYVARERQAVADLETRLVNIRTAVQKVNLVTPLTVVSTTKTVAEWLGWRKEVAPNLRTFLRGLMNGIAQVRQQATQKGLAVVQPGQTPSRPEDVIVNLDEGQLNAEIEAVEEMLATLDGKLSLMNATTLIDVA